MVVRTVLNIPESILTLALFAGIAHLAPPFDNNYFGFPALQVLITLSFSGACFFFLLFLIVTATYPLP